MTLKEIMERVGTDQLGRTRAYVLEGLDEMNMVSETHVKIQRIDIKKDQRFYKFPNEMIKAIDVRVKNHGNSSDEYRSIPRSLHKPPTEDSDGI